MRGGSSSCRSHQISCSLQEDERIGSVCVLEMRISEKNVTGFFSLLLSLRIHRFGRSDPALRMYVLVFVTSYDEEERRLVFTRISRPSS